MSAKKDAELESLRDALKRQEGTVAALEAQLASPAGSMSDPEREALLETLCTRDGALPHPHRLTFSLPHAFSLPHDADDGNPSSR